MNIRNIIWLLVTSICLAAFPGSVHAEDEDVVTVGIIPNPLEVSVSAPSNVKDNKNFAVKTEINNLGDDPVGELIATIYLDESGLSLLEQEKEIYIGTMLPHRKNKVDWVVHSEEPGTYVILVEVRGEVVSGTIISQDSVITTVKESKNRFLNFFQWWY